MCGIVWYQCALVTNDQFENLSVLNQTVLKTQKRIDKLITKGKTMIYYQDSNIYLA